MAVLSAATRFGWCKDNSPDKTQFRCRNCCGRNRRLRLHAGRSARLLRSFSQEKRVCACTHDKHHCAVLRSAEQRSERASTRPAATRAIRTYAHMVTRRFAPRDGLHFLVRAYGFTETLRRASHREGVDMTACHGLGRYKGGCGRSVSPYGGLPEPKRLLRILFLRRAVSPYWLPYGHI